MGVCGLCSSVDVVPGCRESAEKRGNCSEPPATRRKARATSWRTTTEQSCCQFFSAIVVVDFIHSLSRHPLLPHGTVLRSRDGGRGIFHFCLILFLDVIFPGSLRCSRGCVGAKPTWSGWSTAHRPQPATDEPLLCRTLQSHPPGRLSLDSPDKRQRRASAPGLHVRSTSRRRRTSGRDLTMEPATDPDSRWRAGRCSPAANIARWLPLGCKRDLGPVPRGRWRSMAVGRRVARAEGNQRETGAEDDGDAAIRSEEPVQTLPAHHQGAASAVLHHRPSSPCPLVSHPGPWGSHPSPPPFQSPCWHPARIQGVVPWLPWHVVIGADEVLMAQRG